MLLLPRPAGAEEFGSLGLSGPREPQQDLRDILSSSLLQEERVDATSAGVSPWNPLFDYQSLPPRALCLLAK